MEGTRSPAERDRMVNGALQAGEVKEAVSFLNWALQATNAFVRVKAIEWSTGIFKLLTSVTLTLTLEFCCKGGRCDLYRLHGIEILLGGDGDDYDVN